MSRAMGQYQRLTAMMAKVARGEALSLDEQRELRDLARTFNEGDRDEPCVTRGLSYEEHALKRGRDCGSYTPKPDAVIGETLEEALDALRVRVRWYETRRYVVPGRTARAFNALADATGKPDRGAWRRI